MPESPEMTQHRMRLVLILLFGMPASFLPVANAEPGIRLKSFRPGEIWPDDHGNPINAHGGGVLPYEGIYYWFGEHKIAGTAGNFAQVGAHVYSSTDLYNWKDEGIAPRISEDPLPALT